MISENITNITVDKFNQKIADKKVVLLYPWTTYRNLFLTHFLVNLDSGLLYYRIKEDKTSLASWLGDMVEEFDDVLSGFGKSTRDALSTDKPEAMGEALAVDLGLYSNEPTVLFIDEFDRGPLNGETRAFIKAMVKALPAHVQLAVSSRRLNYQPWYELIENGDAVVLGTENRKDDVMFTVEKLPRPQLEVYSLGRGYAIVNGQSISNWDGALPRNLFFYFMDHPLVTRDEIFETFWPDLNVKEATNVFHVTKRKISERISMKVGGARNYELTQYSGGFYMPSDKVIRHYDVADFQEAIEKAMIASSDEQEEKMLSLAIELYKAPFLQTVHMDWANDRRDHLRQLYAQALISMGRLYKRRQELDKSLGFFARSIRETPEREDIHREIMTIYLNMDQVNDAVMQYQALETILRDTLGIGPSRETRELYDIIKAKA